MKLVLIVLMILRRQRDDGNQTLLFNLVYHLITSLKMHHINGESSVPPPMCCACIKIEILLNITNVVITFIHIARTAGTTRERMFPRVPAGRSYINHENVFQLPNVKTLCTAISQMAQEKLPHRSGEVAENMK